MVDVPPLSGHSRDGCATGCAMAFREQLADTAPPPPLSLWRFARVAALSCACLPLTCYWAADQGVDTIISLAVPPVGVTLVLVALNLALVRCTPGLALTTEELILIYSMVATGTAVGSEWMNCINRQIHCYPLFATDSNRYRELILPYLSRLLFFTEETDLKDYLAGGGGWPQLWRDRWLWARPVLAWTFVVTCLSVAMVAINSLMRRQWTQRERLSFPIVAFPYALVEASGPRRPALWHDPALWAAFTGMAAIDLFNGLHFLFPQIPLLKVRFLGDLNAWFSGPPWNSTGWTPIGLFPFIVALATFLPTDLVGSMVFFFFLRKAQQVVAFQMGYAQGVFGGGYLVPAPPYFAEQTWGAFLALFVTALYTARGHLRRLGQRLVAGGTDPDDVPPRWALAALALGVAGVLFVGRFAGLPPLFGAVYVGLYLAFSTALARMRAELGPPTHEMAFMGPNQLVIDAVGTHGMNPKMIVGLTTTFFFFNRIHRSHPMPFELEAMKLAERGGANQRWMALALVLAVIAGSLAAHVMRIYLGYRWGAVAEGWAQSRVVDNLLNHPRRPNTAALSFVGLGFAIVCALNWLRFTVPGFTLHPVGYALAMNFGVDYYWFGLLVAMALKTTVLRTWGLRGYRCLHAAMIGVMLAEYATETLWSLVAMIWRIPTYSISINGRLGWMQ